MKNRKVFKILFLGAMLLSASCIREEAPNAECDITAVNSTWLEEYSEIITGKPTIANKSVSFNVISGISIDSLKKLDPVFELTPGARIEKVDTPPVENGESGVIIYYRTHSEDGMWSKDYEISFTKPAASTTDNIFSFENFTLDASGKFHIWYELINGTRYNWWASSNDGFKMTGKGNAPEDFPTSADSNGYSGSCVKLKTCDTGDLGSMAGMPIAAGSIFIGEFQGENAMKKPLEATRFGLQIAASKPLSLDGYYKYTAGETFTNKNKEIIAGKKDTCSVYAVLYEVDPSNFTALSGIDVMTSERVVLLAELKNPGEPEEWQEFSIPFEPMNNKEFDYNKLLNNEYAITVVASSSKNGGNFEGAIGSTLFIDEFKIVWEQGDTPDSDFGITAVNSNWLEENSDIIIGKPVMINNTIKFNLIEDVTDEEVKALEPEFDLTEGAAIEKLDSIEANGGNETVMFYRVYSKDGKWNKDYRISFKKKALIPINKVFGFEEYALDESGKYHIWSEEVTTGSRHNWWVTANEGFKMTGKGKTPDDYPTTAEKRGVSGSCVKLTTRDTGIIGKAAGTPIAAGNIFIGEYNGTLAMKKPLEAASFGLQILPAKPAALKGYYRYKSGEVYTDKNKEVVEDVKDDCAIYAVVYEVNPADVKPLNGKDITTSSRIVLVAELSQPQDIDAWIEFNIPFKSVEGKDFDYGKLYDDEYAISIVATSSKNGHLFEGAVGSTLFIDEFKIVWEE